MLMLIKSSSLRDAGDAGGVDGLFGGGGGGGRIGWLWIPPPTSQVLKLLE